MALPRRGDSCELFQGRAKWWWLSHCVLQFDDLIVTVRWGKAVLRERARSREAPGEPR